MSTDASQPANRYSHDDITYQSIAKAFGLPLKLHDESHKKMKQFSKPHPSQPNFSWDEDSPTRKAKLRMIELPTDESRDDKSQVIFPVDDLWVPVACINGNVHICKDVPIRIQRTSFIKYSNLESLRNHRA
jgi:hypothetical protein